MTKQQSPASRKDAAIGFGILAVLALIIGSCSVATFGGDDKKTGPAPVAAIPRPTTGTAPPAVDEAAREMCRYSALAVAHQKRGNRSQADEATTEVESALADSDVVAVEKLATTDTRQTAARVRAWCKKNVPVKTPKVRKMRQTAEPTPDSGGEEGTASNGSGDRDRDRRTPRRSGGRGRF